MARPRIELNLTEAAERAESALRQSWPSASIVSIKPLKGGASSLTYEAEVEGGEDKRIVIKIAPPGLPPVRNRDVLRQARLMHALASVDGVKVPKILGTDTGTPPETPPLFVMTFVEGESHEPYHMTKAPPSPSDARIRAIGASRMLARLHSVDIGTLDLGDEPAISPRDEVERWDRALATVDSDLSEGLAKVRNGLLANVPNALPPAALHGEWRLGNLICRGGDILAAIDWEIWSVSDPRIDLAWFLVMADPDHPTAKAPGEGMPDIAELLAVYEESAGRKIVDLDWFIALIWLKHVATSALIVKNNRKRTVPDPRYEKMVPRIRRFMGLATVTLETGSPYFGDRS
ncbi:phosphotransferase family protein [Parasphingorhabdus sp.]|uniref:phosphotransferase family protein n=1 Tax=Parasphingorhabdus sp. TaxID=2709688 RepID=UPI003A95B2EE